MEPTFTVEPPPPQRQPPKRNPGAITGGLVGLGALAIKFFSVILVVLKTGGTMLLSIGAYSLIWDWKFATGMVVLIFVHEMGHFLSAKCYGIPVSAPVFIPFVGAYVLLQKQRMNSWTNAVISLAGPLAGGIGGWVCYYLASPLGCPWMLGVASYTFILNFGNLLPIAPLDGSHIWTAFSSPDMSFSDRAYLGVFVALVIAGLILGFCVANPYLRNHHHSW